MGPKPKVEIDYPPLTLRKWKPPALHLPHDPLKKKKFLRKPIYPIKMARHKYPTLVGKIWHRYKMPNPGMCVLRGHFNQSTKKYLMRDRGKQQSASCVAIIGLMQVWPPDRWNEHALDTILQLGERMYRYSCHINQLKSINCIYDLYTTFYIGYLYMVLSIEEPIIGRLFKEKDVPIHLKEALTDFFISNQYCVVEVEGRQITLFKFQGGYYLFDPHGRDENGDRIQKLIPHGAACMVFEKPALATVLRFTRLRNLVLNIQENVDDRETNLEFRIYPVSIKRRQQKNFFPPQNLQEFRARNKLVVEKEKELKREAMKQGPVEVPPPSYATDLEQGTEKDIRIPIQSPKEPSVTFFRELIPKKFGILRSNFHQNDKTFSRFAGKQSLANAVSAIAMLRDTKSRHWIKVILDNVLLTGEALYRESRKNLSGDQELGIKQLTDRIMINNKYYTPVIEEATAHGVLNSKKFEVLNLLNSLEEFFADRDTAIIRGPVTIAVWQEQGRYYMFDPNERDAEGKKILKLKKLSNEAEEPEEGVACLTWHSDLKSLVNTYMNNLPEETVRDPFIISAIEVKDYSQLPSPWHLFNPLDYGKWILRGRMHQDDRIFSEESRNQQGTAMAVMALIMCSLKPINTWERETIGDILETGDRLYNYTVAELNRKNQFVSPKLLLREIITRFQVLDEEIVLNIDDCMFNGIVSAADSNEILNLKRGLEKFFLKEKTGVVTAKGLSVGVWKDNDAYYMFDSHSRNEKGFQSYIGTACCMRFLNLSDLVDVLTANLNPDTKTLFNIGRVEVCIWENIDGVARPPLNNFTELSPTSAVLRASTHQGDEDVFDIHASQQTIPNLLAGLAMPGVLPTVHWNQSTLDEILQVGQKLYEATKEHIIYLEKYPPKVPEPEEPEDVMLSLEPPPLLIAPPEPEDEPGNPDIGMRNVLTEFKIGLNKFKMTQGERIKGVFEDDPLMKPRIPKGKNQIEIPKGPGPLTLEKALTDYLDDEGDEVKRAVIMSESITVAVWREDGVYYLFDPEGKDQEGNAIGQELWSAKHYPEEPVGEEQAGKDYDEENVYKIEDGGIDTAINPLSQNVQETAVPEEIHEEDAEKEEDDQIMSFTVSTISVDMSDAKACLLQFLSVDKLVDHIVENITPNSRETDFWLIPVDFENKPDLKDKRDAVERSKGNWNKFVEIDVSHWILRGSLNMTNAMYPICNRGNQFSAMNIMALAYFKLFDLNKFTEQTVNDILKYGDRLHTCITKSRNQNAKKINLDLNDAEVCLLLNQQRITTRDIMTTFLVGDYRVEVNVFSRDVQGDVTAKDHEEILDVERGLRKFFDANEFGVFESKNVMVGLFKLEDFYFMFDPASRGPNGVVEENGMACITRHSDLRTVAEIINANLEKDGLNDFTIDAVMFKIEYANRPQPPMEKVISINPKITAFEEINPGKLILSGNYNQNNPKFEKMTNAATCCNALVALAMAHIHKPETWSRPIVDDVLTNGNLLFDLTKEQLGFDFNPWEDTMSLDLVNKVFKIGVWQVKVEFKDDVQHGILNIKHPTIFNLRRACEYFFEHNTHGVIEADCQTCAVWVENDLFYTFDPYPRGSTGMYQVGGSACLMVFKSIKMMTDHFLENIPCNDCEFQITPVAIFTEEIKDKKKKIMAKCQILKCKDIPIFDKPDEDSGKCRKKSKRKDAAKKTEEEPSAAPGPCDKILEKKEWARQMSILRSKKELDRILRQMRREYCTIATGVAILRGHYSQNNHRFSKASKNHQAIPNALVAIVMSKLHEPSTWTYKNIEIVLDSGDVLYKDSWWFYKPLNPILGLKNVLRTFHIEHAKFSTNIYKSAIMGDLVFRALYVGLLNFFLHETSGIVTTKVYNVAVFQKAGFYYLFDPYDRDREGRCVKCGCACVLRFESVELMAKKILDNAMCYACPCQCGRLGEDCPEELEELKEPTTDMRYAVHAVTLENLTPCTPCPSVKETSSSCATDDIV